MYGIIAIAKDIAAPKHFKARYLMRGDSLCKSRIKQRFIKTVDDDSDQVFGVIGIFYATKYFNKKIPFPIPVNGAVRITYAT